MEFLTKTEKSNNQLFIDLYFISERLEKSTRENNDLMEQYKIAVEQVRGKEWIVETKKVNIREHIKIIPL